MLKGISPLLSPDLLAALCRMGHADEVVFADAHFPACSLGVEVIRADGLKIPDLLEAVLPLLELDSYDSAPAMMMDVVAGDQADPQVELSYQASIDRHQSGLPRIGKLERFAFYEQAKKAHVVVATGDTAKYANLILKKGVTPQ